MCNPAAIAMMAVSLLTTTASAYSQSEAAEDTLDAQNAASKAQIQENNKAAALDKLENQRSTMRNKAASQAGAADAGVGGNSMLREYATLEIQGQHDEGIIESSRKSANTAAEALAAVNAASYESQIASAQSTVLGGVTKAASYGTSGLN